MSWFVTSQPLHTADCTQTWGKIRSTDLRKTWWCGYRVWLEIFPNYSRWKEHVRLWGNSNWERKVLKVKDRELNFGHFKSIQKDYSLNTLPHPSLPLHAPRKCIKMASIPQISLSHINTGPALKAKVLPFHTGLCGHMD